MGSPGGMAAVDYGPEEAALRAYCEAGAGRAHALGNRGPVRFDAIPPGSPMSSSLIRAGDFWRRRRLGGNGRRRTGRSQRAFSQIDDLSATMR